MGRVSATARRKAIGVSARSVRRVFDGGVIAVDDLTLDVEAGAFVAERFHLRLPEIVAQSPSGDGATSTVPSDAAAVKLLWLAIITIEDKRALKRAKEAGKAKIESAHDIDARQFLPLQDGIVFQLLRLTHEVGFLRIRLRTH